MITLWVNKDSLDFFVSMMKKLDIYDDLICDYLTYPPKNKKKYIQVQVTYDEFVQLEDRNVVNK
jgi:hypothetical protein